MANDVLQLAGISKRFNGVPALSDVSLTLSAGSVHGLIGQNGAGKSTLIKVLAGLHHADGGAIRIDGASQRIATPNDARRLGIEIVHQDRLLGGTQTVAEILALGHEPTLPAFAAARSAESTSTSASISTSTPTLPPRATSRGAFPLALLRPWKMRRDAADAVRRHFGIELTPSRLIGTLSVAEQQIVQITRALTRAPRILVFDEPTAALSAQEAARLFRAIEGLKAQGLAILYVSHYLDEIHALCDQVSVLRDGANVAHFTVAHSHPQQWLTAMIGSPDDVTAAPAARGSGRPARDESAAPSALLTGSATAAPPAAPTQLAPRLQLHAFGAAGRFDDISLHVRAGEIVGITGLLGSGGKELVRSLFGLEANLGGEVRLDGRVIHPSTPRAAIAHGIAFIPEDRRAHGIALDLPVRDNMTLVSLKRFVRYGRIDRRRERARVQEQIDALRIVAPGPEAPARHLSGGNQQKVVLAKWLDTHATLYLLDEPTVGIDVGAKREVYRLLQRLSAEGAAVLLYSTDLLELLGQTDRIFVMARGRIVRHVAAADTDAHELLAWASGAAAFQESA